MATTTTARNMACRGNVLGHHKMTARVHRIGQPSPYRLSTGPSRL